MSGQGRWSSAVRLLGIVLLASVATCFCATRVFWTFDFARIKMLRGPVAAVDGSVEVPAQDDEFKMLAAPAALIARVRNESDAVQSFAFQVDGALSCTVSVPPMTARRIDCSVESGWDVAPRSCREDTGCAGPLDARLSGAGIASREDDRAAAGVCVAGRLPPVPAPTSRLARPRVGRSGPPPSHQARFVQVTRRTDAVCRCRRRHWSHRRGDPAAAVALGLFCCRLSADVRRIHFRPDLLASVAFRQLLHASCRCGNERVGVGRQSSTGCWRRRSRSQRR